MKGDLLDSVEEVYEKKEDGDKLKPWDERKVKDIQRKMNKFSKDPLETDEAVTELKRKLKGRLSKSDYREIEKRID